MLSGGGGRVEEFVMRGGRDLGAIAEDDVAFDGEVVGARFPFEPNPVHFRGRGEVGRRGRRLFVALDGRRRGPRGRAAVADFVLGDDAVGVGADGGVGVAELRARGVPDLAAVAQDDVAVDPEVVGARMPLQVHHTGGGGRGQGGGCGGRRFVERDRNRRVPSTRRLSRDAHRPTLEGLPHPERRVLESGGRGIGVDQQGLRCVGLSRDPDRDAAGGGVADVLEDAAALPDLKVVVGGLPEEGRLAADPQHGRLARRVQRRVQLVDA